MTEPLQVAQSVSRQISSWDRLPAAQQPDWADHPLLPQLRSRLSAARPLVPPEQTRTLADTLAIVAEGNAVVLQAGDCAESFHELTPAHIRARLAVLDTVADALATRVGLPVVRIGRMAGQFAKPRSAGTEVVHGQVLPTFRGHAVNSATPRPKARRHDPLRLLKAYQASASVLRWLNKHRSQRPDSILGPWSSHEALLLDYEAPQVQRDEATGLRYLTSTHLPWIGYRTSQPDHAHVALLATVANPIAVKVGPGNDPAQITKLCSILDPDRRPGRLTLIVRMGSAEVTRLLPPIAAAVQKAGHTVVWLSDPLHGNTVTVRNVGKTRLLTDVVLEAVRFHDVLAQVNAHAGGLHLELAAGDVTECIGGPVKQKDLESRYQTLCDPRLNPAQAALLIDQIPQQRRS